MSAKIRGNVFIKILIPMVIVWAAWHLFKAGYGTGQWLHHITHN